MGSDQSEDGGGLGAWRGSAKPWIDNVPSPALVTSTSIPASGWANRFPTSEPPANEGFSSSPGAGASPTGTIGWPPHSSDTGAPAPRTTTTSVAQTLLAHLVPGLRSTWCL